MEQYPLIFKFKDIISGSGYIAGVEAQGRVLMTLEEDTWWVYGVCPGGLAECGATPSEAYLRFRTSFRDALSDISNGESDFDIFISRVKEFVGAENAEEKEAWLEARKAIRKGELKPQEPFVAELPRIHNENEASVLVDVIRLGIAPVTQPNFSSETLVFATELGSLAA